MVQRIRLRLHAYPTHSEEPSPPRLRLTISAAMSPNAITHRYPQVSGLFDQLHVDRQQEGCDSLDELAWRRGMNVAELLAELQRLALTVRGRQSGAAGSAS